MVRCCIICGYGITAQSVMNGCGEYIHFGSCLTKYVSNLPPLNKHEIEKHFLI